MDVEQLLKREFPRFETGRAGECGGPNEPLHLFRPRYSEHADDKVEPEDVPKGKDPDAVTAGERELDSEPESRTQILDQRLNELPLDHEAQAKLTPS